MISKTLAQKVDWLFNLCRNEQGRHYTYGQVQRASNNRITASYVWKLRTGAMSNPGLIALEALSDCFDVPLCYFADGGEYLEESIRVVHALPTHERSRQQALQLLAEHAEHLSDRSLGAVLEMAEYLQVQETKLAQVREAAAPDALAATLRGC